MTFSTCSCFPFTCKQKLCHIIDTKAHLHKISSQVLRCVLTDPTAHKEGNIQIWGCKKMFQNVYNIAYSQAVTHPSTNATQCCLTSVIGRELVLSTWYGRRHWYMEKFDHHIKTISTQKLSDFVAFPLHAQKNFATFLAHKLTYIRFILKFSNVFSPPLLHTRMANCKLQTAKRC